MVQNKFALIQFKMVFPALKWHWMANLLIYGLCHFRPHCRPCRLMSCHFRHYVAWSNFDLLSHCVSFKVHDILKTHRIIIIFVYFMGNYVTFKNYTKKTSNHFIHFTSRHFSLTVKIYVALGMITLCHLQSRHAFNYHNYLALCTVDHFIKLFR